MIEQHIKEALLNAMTKPENVWITYPITETLTDKKEVYYIAIFYSKQNVFAGKIYIIEIDDSVNLLNIKNPFDSHYSDQAIDSLYLLYNQITNTFKDNSVRYNNLNENNLKLSDLTIEKKSEKLRLKKAIEQQYK
jgi:hypothetical protein